jgi:ribosome-associated protein
MRDFSSELQFKTTRSSGAGGQNVNKVETSVTVFWEVLATIFFNETEKQRILLKLKNKINREGFLILSVSEERSQLRNKKIAIDKIVDWVNEAIVVPKVRKKTKATLASKERRLEQKKHWSEKKANRKFRM